MSEEPGMKITVVPSLDRRLRRIAVECANMSSSGGYLYLDAEEAVAIRAALRSPADVDLREAEALRERVMKVIHGGYKPIIDRHQQDQCIHGRLVETEDCIGCYDEALLEALSSGESQ